MPTPLQDATAALQAAIASPTPANCEEAVRLTATLAYRRLAKRLADARLLGEALSDESKTFAQANIDNNPENPP